MMEETTELLKKYWPYALGGVVGLYIILKYAGGSSSSGSSDYGAYLQAQTAASAQQAQLGLQAQMQQSQIDAQTTQANNQYALAQQSLDVQNSANYANAFNTFQNTQANMAQALGGAASQVIGALNAPAITALQAGALENSSALQAAGNVAAQSFLAQGQVSQGTSNMFGNAIKGLSGLGQFSAPQPPGPVTSAVGTAGRAVAAYYTMGGSEAFNAASNNSLYGSGSSSLGGSSLGGSSYSNNLNTSGLGTYNPTGS